MAATLVIALLASCGGGSTQDSHTTGNALLDGYGPGNPSACPHGQPTDIWFPNRLGCLAIGQRFISSPVNGGDSASRAYLFGQEALDTRLGNLLGPGMRRDYRYALCVTNVPTTASPLSIANDLGVALGLNILATGSAFYPVGVSGSSFWYGGFSDNTVVVPSCDPEAYALTVDYITGRVVSVNAAAWSRVQVFDQ